MNNWTKTVERYLREGRTISGGCGSSGTQKQLQAEQLQNYNTMVGDAQTIFSGSSDIFKQLVTTYSPIVAAGPGQPGFTAAEDANLKSQAITQGGISTRNAMQAAGQAAAAYGGGTSVLPSGAVLGQEGQIAEAGAASTAQNLSNIDIQNAILGQEKWQNAAQVLAGAPNVFNAATSFENAATGAGQAVGQTAGEMAGQTMQLWSAGIGAAGQAAAAVGQAL